MAELHAEDVAAAKVSIQTPSVPPFGMPGIGRAQAHVQVRLRDVKDGVPCVEALVEESLQILGKAELIEDVRQFSHTVALCLANTSRVCR